MDKLLWMNEDITYMFRKNIVECDMQSASLAVSERFHLIEPNRLEQLKSMPKDQRVREVGLMQRSDKEFSTQLLEGIVKTRQEFLDMNHISEDDIICLHSDAIIFNQTEPIIDTVDTVKFVIKNNWSSYIRYGKVEIYYGDGVITYKGIPKEMLKYHTLGLNMHLLKVFKMVETMDDGIVTYLTKFQRRYLQGNLPEYYYIPFGKQGEYKIENLKLLALIANIVSEDMYEW